MDHKVAVWAHWSKVGDGIGETCFSAFERNNVVDVNQTIHFRAVNFAERKTTNYARSAIMQQARSTRFSIAFIRGLCDFSPRSFNIVLVCGSSCG
jgi:hypothetical protein